MLKSNMTLTMKANPNPIVENGGLTTLTTQKITLISNESSLPKTGDEPLYANIITGTLGVVCILVVVWQKIRVLKD